MAAETIRPFFELDEAREFRLAASVQLDAFWDRPCAFFWILTLAGAAYCREAGRSHYLSRGWVWTGSGSIRPRLRLYLGQDPWHCLVLTGDSPFLREHADFMNARVGSVHQLPSRPTCATLGRRLATFAARSDPWTRARLGYAWFQAWRHDAERQHRRLCTVLPAPGPHDNLLQDFVSLKSLAQQVGYSPNHFSRLLADLWKTGPARALRAARLTVAARLLLESDISVESLGNRLGYLSESAFIRAFRRTHGLAPGGYRARHRLAPAACREDPPLPKP